MKTEQERLEYINTTCNTNYESMDEVNWGYHSMYTKLPEHFIREFSDKVDWEYISYYQQLSEPFIREFAHKVDWNDVSTSQKLPLTSIVKYAKYLNWTKVYYNNNNFKDYIIDSCKAKFKI